MTNIEKRYISEDGRSYVDMETNELNPCLTCGACCDYFRISFYGGEVLSGFPPEDLTMSLGSHMACMKGTEHGGRCIALTGQIGQSISCSCYSDRPSVCREYEVWDSNGLVNPRCNKARRKHNLPELPPTKEEYFK